MRIGLTDDRVNDQKYALYEKWLSDIFALRAGAETGGETGTLETVRLTPGDGNGALAAECDGVVLTGGCDVDPLLYGGDPAHPTLSGVSPARDRFETDVLRSCIRTRTPVLGICRGMQLANVALGGGLIVDLDEAGYGAHRGPKGNRFEHAVGLGPASALRGAAGIGEGRVVSSHHQAVDRVGRGLIVVATSPDGVIEALESDGAAGSGDLLLVQWHPEREENRDEPLCGAPGTVFFESIVSKIQSNGKLA